MNTAAKVFSDVGVAVKEIEKGLCAEPGICQHDQCEIVLNMIGHLLALRERLYAARPFSCDLSQ